MKKEEIADVKKRITLPMSDADLEKYTGVTPEEILKYCDLHNYATIEDLLPEDKSFRIILIEKYYNNGHWVAAMRYGQTIEYFNSYGLRWDADWKFITRMIRFILGEGTNEMSRLMNQAADEGYQTIYNHTPFQKFSKTVNTCGRWCVFRVETMRMNYSLPEFSKFVHDQAKRLKHSKDFVVAKFVK
jgi:hypothetical protein